MWVWRIRNEEWRIPADSLAEAEAILCLCLGVATLPEEARFIGHQ